MKNGLLVIFLVLLFPISIVAEEDTKINTAENISFTFGSMTENSTDRFDYTVNYIVIEPRDGSLRIQYDTFNNPVDYRRFWLSGQPYQLVGKLDFKLFFRPGILVDNRGRIYYGGFIDFDLPKAGLNSHYRCYAGNRADKHIVFSNFKIAKGLCLQHFYYTESGSWTPDSYLGPRINGRLVQGKTKFEISVWGGYSINRPNATSWDFSISTKF